MYQITCDNQILYDIRSKNRIVTSPKLTLETGKNGTLSFRIPKTNPMHDLINLKKSVFRVFQVDLKDNKKIYTQLFRGMAYSKEDDFYLRGQVEVEGELAFFNDTVIRPYDYKGSVIDLFKKYVNEHNSRVDDFKKFYVRNCTVTDNNDYITRANENYPSTKEELDNKLIDLLGGHFETEEVKEIDQNGNIINKVYIDYLADYTEYNKQPIIFGRNMLDFTKFISAEDIKTVIIPLGKKEDNDYITIKSVNDGKDYIEDTAAINVFGRIEGTVKHEDVTVPSNLLSKAKQDLEDSINLSTTINITAADLHELNVDIEALRIGRLTRVISMPHKWDKYMLLTKLELNLDNVKSSRVTLGKTYKTFTEKQLENQKQSASFTQSTQKITNLDKDMTQVKTDVSNINTVITKDIPTEYVKTENFEKYKDDINSKVSRVYRIKGSVDSYNTLLSMTEVEEGDVYNCSNSGANYVFTEEGWDKFSETIDLSEYITTADAEQKFVTITVLEEQYTKKDIFEELVQRVSDLETKLNEGGNANG